MKRPAFYLLSRTAQPIAVAVVSLGLVSCETLLGGMGGVLPFYVTPKCLTMDATNEILTALKESPTIESAIERVNTAARIIEIGDLIVHTLPISGGSEWPKQVNGSVSMVENAKFRQQQASDIPLTIGQASALKLKAMYLQTVLFAKSPDFYAPRKMGAAVPAESEVKALAAKVLGRGYSPAFTKVFYRFLQYNPDFEPKADLFAGRLNGQATEVYPSLLDAVVSLAENKSEIVQLREFVIQAEEKKAKERRDILELSQRIQKLEAENNGSTSTPEKAAKTSGRDTNAKELEELKAQLAVKEEEFKTAVKAYRDELEKLSIEMTKIKTQSMAFNPEQRALAANIQMAVDAVQGTLCQSEILLGIAGYHLTTAVPNWRSEISVIARQSGQAADQRIERITTNLVLLPSNVSVLTTELRVLHEEAKGYDDLFASRITVDTSGGIAERAGWPSWLPRLQ